ncbi:hypothetical protein SPBR_07017 [Sporothrix brasiliensis 5110]|uniref:Ubiquitin-conjugating enzyme E2C-binding protein n=1 Tax=Sporothrix brasiliensis 5110 TaxID=1398154 RepID=A0A0C2ETD7_9PEZI|nr:uncharacterized protein SPBR_07017 [Sporothrix brasiliensis 5110]KIH89724.1 hypothetical protein SPBR_07017 [Sporothrix brasiliensis 5110]
MPTTPIAATPPIQLYAELLVNIRQVSVSASFAGPIEARQTTAEVLPDGVTLRVRRRGKDDGDQQTAVLTLPGRVAVTAAGAPLPVPGPALASGYVAWRLPLQGPTTQNGQTDDTELAPWSAPDLSVGSSVRCRGCSAELVAAHRIEAWKDLPSDNWAEMMEFWHCHKPDVKETETAGGPGAAAKNGEDTGTGLASRGYGANSTISVDAGVGFVDLTTLLVSEVDCQGVLFSESTVDKASSRLDDALSTVQTAATNAAATTANTVAAPRGLSVLCAACRAQVGYFTLRQQAIHLFKWQVQVATAGQQGQPTIADCVAATLVATIQRTGSSKSLIVPIYELEGRVLGTEDTENVLQVWVLNGSIVYSSGRSRNPSTATPSRAVKLLYKHIPRAEADAILESLNSDVQEINLPRETIGAVTELLESSTQLLPARDRDFKEWRIGVLDRWDPRRHSSG